MMDKVAYTQTPRQKEISDAALDLISRKGIQGLTIKNLSKMIGISEPAIYRHYDNKIDILLAILQLFRENTEKHFAWSKNVEMGAMEKIAGIFQRHFASFAATPSLVSVIFSEELFRGEPRLITQISEIIEKNYSILTGIVRDGQENGEVRQDIEAGHLTMMILGALRLLVKKWQFSGYSFDLEAEGQKLQQSIQSIMLKV